MKAPSRTQHLYLRFLSGEIPNLIQVITSVSILNYFHRDPYLAVVFAVLIPLLLASYLNTAFDRFLQDTHPGDVQRKHYVYHAATVLVLALAILGISWLILV